MFERVQICTVSDTLRNLQRPPPVRSTRCSVSSVRAAVCPGSGTACPAACDVQSVRVRWGHPGGIGPEARVGAVSPVSSDQNKKGVFQCPSRQHPPHLHKTKPFRLCKSPKIPKNTKRPLSEPRLCYNQLKATSQRKGESK